MGRPRYQRARLLGDGLINDLAQAYLAEVSQRLRPGSFKSVRFALSLLTSHLGKHPVGDLSLSHGKEVLGYITQLSPNVRKYRDGKDAGLVGLASLSVASEGITLAPQTQARILKQMSQFLDWCVGEGELTANELERDRGHPPTYVGQGVVFVQVLQGEAIYRYGQQQFTLATGDSISVDAELSHGFIEVLTPKFVFLTVQAERP